MKICLYSPYLPKHFGGGEKYILDCAASLSQTHHVVIAVPSVKNTATLKKKYEQFFGLDLSQVDFIESPLGTSTSFFKKLWWTKHWDVLYYLTDGSLFFSLAKKNILHIQFPFTFAKKAPLERLKLSNWHVKNTNSYFTKNVIEQSWQTPIDLVHWPLIQTHTTKSQLPKEKIILNVGRFFRHLHSKRQDVLVDIFTHLNRAQPSVVKGWKLVLVGGVEDETYFEQVKKQAEGWPIEFHTDVDRTTLESWYQRASIYWHATGYDIDEGKEPEKVEHFGISTVEAMSYGCVPIVIGKGGQKEILGDELGEWLWQTQTDCVEKTLAVIQAADRRNKVSQLAQERTKVFGKARFEKQLNSMVK